MNKTKYNQLRKAIISAVPEIVWRKCLVCGYIHPKGNFGYCNINGCECFLNNRCEEGVRPITLEDCLIAIEKKYKRRYTLLEIIKCLEDNGKESNWDLGKSLQWHAENKPEVIDLLWDLICKDG